MFRRLADLGLRRPRRVLIVSLLWLLVAGVLGGPASGALDAPDPFNDPASESATGGERLERVLGREADPSILVLVDAAPAEARVADLARTVGDVAGVEVVDRPLDGAPSPLASEDGERSLITANLATGADPGDVVAELERRLGEEPGVALGGAAVAQEQVGAQAGADLGRAELLAFPLLALLTLLFFRGVAALLPLLVGGLTVLSTFVVLRGIDVGFELSPFALNLVIGLGLGLAIDYSLFVVSRFREELGAGATVEEAVRTTTATAGRTVVFSAVTVAAALACLLVFPQRFLVSMGMGGVVAGLLAAAISLLVLPGLMRLLGARLGRVRPAAEGTGRWHALARRVMRRPGAVAVVATVLMLALAAPSLQTTWTGVDATILPPEQSARAVSDAIAADFPGLDGGTVTVVARGDVGDRASLRAYAGRLGEVDGVRAVGPPEQGGGLWRIEARLGDGSASPAAVSTVGDLRSVPAPVPVEITGGAAETRDQQAAVADGLPLAAILLLATTFVLLWLMTGSVVLPLKAIVMNVLTVAAATGILVLVFQDGRLEGLLGYESQGGIELTDFLVFAALAFGLSTDYGVFLLTRIKEHRDAGRPDREAVALGLQRTGAVVTAAAILLAVAIGAFLTSELVFLQQIGLATAAAVLLDAFVVRALLVPSLMALLGRWNWWSPAPLRRLHERIGLHEGGPARASRGATDPGGADPEPAAG